MAEISYEIIVLTRPSRARVGISLWSLHYRTHCLGCIYLSRRLHSIHTAGLNIASRQGLGGGEGLGLTNLVEKQK